MDDVALVDRFKAYPLTKQQNDRMQTMRADALRMADHLNRAAKDSREKSTAITKLEEAVMWANRAIAVAPEDH